MLSAATIILIIIHGNSLKSSSPPTELEVLTHTGSVNLQETKTLSSKHALLDIKMEVAAGNLSQYPGNDGVFNYHLLNIANSLNLNTNAM